MIPAQTIYNEVQSLLDAEGTSAFDVNLDYIPAMNRGQKYLVSIINSVLGGKKFADEYYRDLVKCQIFQTSQWSRLQLKGQNNEEVWDVLNIVVNPVLNSPFVPIVVPNGLSAPLPNYFYVSGGTGCERVTVSEMPDNAQNPFSGGYSAEPTGQNLRYAYVQYTDYFNGLFPVPHELGILPAYNVLPVAVFFAMMPPDVTALSDNIAFPIIFTDIMTKATWREILLKTGQGGLVTYRYLIYSVLDSLKSVFPDSSIAEAQAYFWIATVENLFKKRHLQQHTTGSYLTRFGNVPVLYDGRRQYMELPAGIFDYDFEKGIEYISYTTALSTNPFTQVFFQMVQANEAYRLYYSKYEQPTPKNPYAYRVGDRLYFLGTETVSLKQVECALYSAVDPRYTMVNIDSESSLNPEQVSDVIKAVLNLGRWVLSVPSYRTESGTDGRDNVKQIPLQEQQPSEEAPPQPQE
jgi:hypothetical protein